MRKASKMLGLMSSYPLLAVACVSMVACSAKPSDSYAPEETVGSVRTYQVELRAPGRELVRFTRTYRTEGTQRIGDQLYYRVSTEESIDAQSKRFHYRRQDDFGIWIRSDDSPNSPEHRTLQFPLVEGATWPFGANGLSYVVGGREPVSLANRTYPDCIKVTMLDSDGAPMTTSHFCRGVGSVFHMSGSTENGATETLL